MTKIWGVGLTLVLATTMLLFPMPASAGTLSWGSESIPSTSGYVLNAGNVVDLAVSTDGDVIYAAAGTEYIYRSSDGGESWSIVHVVDGTDSCDVTDIAVAPDDENYIAAAGDNTSERVVFISDDGGANWDALGDTGLTAIHDLALSAAKSGNHYASVAGDATVWYYKIGTVGAVWTNAGLLDGFAAGQEKAGAVAFSPNFASDEVMVAVTANFTSAIEFQIFSFDQAKWNSNAGFTEYPVEIVGATADAVVDALDSASISLSPDYLGSDDSMRLSFVGITTGGTATADDADGIFRLDEDSVDALKEDKNIHSVDFDGTNLVAGRYDSTIVYRCADPLGSSPSVSGSASLKSPGGTGLGVVAFAGANVVAGTSGDESAFAISENDGKTFNDISLIDTSLDTLSDVAVSSDGVNLYLVSANETGTSTDLSLWRYASRWERVLSVIDNDGYDDFIVRTAADDMDVIYVADKDGTKIYYSTDAGQDKWHTRISTETIEDLAVETGGSVVYVASAGGYVSTSTNSGFTWATKKSSKLSGGISMLTSLGEDLLLAGSEDGKAAYSKDGNSSWTKLDDGMTSGVVSVAADGLDEGDLIVAGISTVSDHLYRWDWDDAEWDEIADVPTGYATYGIALQGGVLYSISGSSTDNTSKLARSLNPTADEPSYNTVDSAGEIFSRTPSALRVSVSDTTTKLWAVDEYSVDQLFSYSDTIAVTAPTLLSPREGFGNKMNPISGKAFDITFSWTRPSTKVTAYDFQIALDSAFDEIALSQVLVNDGSTVGVVAGPTGSTITTDAVAYSFSIEYMPDTTYYWRVRVDAVTPASTDYGPVRGQWSEVRSFKVADAEVTPAVEVGPAPQITVSVPPAPSITVTPEIIIPTPEIVLPAPQVTLPPSPAPVAPIPGWALYIIIIIGAVLVISLIVLILRTRRPV